MRKLRINFGLFFILVLITVYSAFSADTNMQVATYYPSADVDAMNLDAEEIIITETRGHPLGDPDYRRPIYIIKSDLDGSGVNGWLTVGDSVNGDVFRIDNTGTTFLKNSYIDEIFAAPCKYNYLTHSTVCRSNRIVFDDLTLRPYNGIPGYVELSGVRLERMPIITGASTDTEVNNFFGFVIGFAVEHSSDPFDNYKNTRLGCYNCKGCLSIPDFNPDNPNDAYQAKRDCLNSYGCTYVESPTGVFKYDINQCLENADVQSKNAFYNIARNIGGRTYQSKKKLVYKVTKQGYTVFGMGVGFQISGNFGAGIALLFDTIGGYTNPDYKTFEYVISEDF